VSHADVLQSINRKQLKTDDVLTSYADGLLFKMHEFWCQHPNALLNRENCLTIISFLFRYSNNLNIKLYNAFYSGYVVRKSTSEI
jgi:hypothetical protein